MAYPRVLTHIPTVIRSEPVIFLPHQHGLFETEHGQHPPLRLAGALQAENRTRVRHREYQQHQVRIAEALLCERIAARDAMLQHLGRKQDAIEEEAESTETLIKRYVGLAMAARRGIDRTFWLLSTADVIRGEREVDYKTLLRLGVRRIHGTDSVPHREGLTATRLLYAKVLPVS